MLAKLKKHVERQTEYLNLLREKREITRYDGAKATITERDGRFYVSYYYDDEYRGLTEIPGIKHFDCALDIAVDAMLYGLAEEGMWVQYRYNGSIYRMELIDVDYNSNRVAVSHYESCEDIFFSHGVFKPLGFNPEFDLSESRSLLDCTDVCEVDDPWVNERVLESRLQDYEHDWGKYAALGITRQIDMSVPKKMLDQIEIDVESCGFHNTELICKYDEYEVRFMLHPESAPDGLLELTVSEMSEEIGRMPLEYYFNNQCDSMDELLSQPLIMEEVQLLIAALIEMGVKRQRAEFARHAGEL